MSGRLDRGDRVDRHAPVRREQRQLVDRHVLEHALGVALEALGQLVGRVGVVVHERELAAGALGQSLAALGHVGRDVLVEAHEDLDARLLAAVAQILELADRRSPGLLEEDVGAAVGDDLLDEAGHVRGPRADLRGRFQQAWD